MTITKCQEGRYRGSHRCGAEEVWTECWVLTWRPINIIACARCHCSGVTKIDPDSRQIKINADQLIISGSGPSRVAECIFVFLHHLHQNVRWEEKRRVAGVITIAPVFARLYLHWCPPLVHNLSLSWCWVQLSSHQPADQPKILLLILLWGKLIQKIQRRFYPTLSHCIQCFIVALIHEWWLLLTPSCRELIFPI